MDKTMTASNQLAYITPSCEVIHMDSTDVISASGNSDAFWGEEHNFKGEYTRYEW